MGVSKWEGPLQQDPLAAGLQLGTCSTQGGDIYLSDCDHCRLRPADSEQRERVWSLLRGLLETYSRLREEDQSFAVEVPCHRVSLTFRTPWV